MKDHSVPQPGDTPIVARIREILRARGWSAYDMARECGLGAPNRLVMALERNVESIATDVASKIAKNARVRLAWLVDGELPRDADASPVREFTLGDLPGWQAVEEELRATAAEEGRPLPERALVALRSVRCAPDLRPSIADMLTIARALAKTNVPERESTGPRPAAGAKPPGGDA